MKGMLSEEGQRRVNFLKGRELKGGKTVSMSPVMLSGKSSRVRIPVLQMGETQIAKQLVQDATPWVCVKKSLIIQSQTAFHKKDK